MKGTPKNTTTCEPVHPVVVDRFLAVAADRRTLDKADADTLAELLIEAERAAQAVQAARYRVLMALDRHPLFRGGPIQDVAADVACALRISERAAETQIAEARMLEQVFPETLEELAAGRVQVAQVRALIDTTATLDDATARAVQERVLPLMGEQNPAATRKALSRAVLKVDPEGAARRHEVARKDRRVAHYPESDGMSTVAATLPAEQAVHAMAVIDAHARAAKQEPGDVRTLEQARADSFYQLVTGKTGAFPTAVVSVTVGVDTLLGIGQEPGDLAEYGPVSAQTARMLAAQDDAVWRRLLTAPQTGMVVKTDPFAYRPTAEVRRHVSARDGHCHFPGCAMPAAKTDLDHVVAFDHRRPERGGLTTVENLQPLCRRHHRLKTLGGWRVQRSETGVNTTPTTIWAAPSGRKYAKTA